MYWIGKAVDEGSIVQNIASLINATW